MTSNAGAEPRVAYLVARVERALRAQLDRTLSELGVTTPEYTALSILGARDGLSSAQLARRVLVSPQAMNQIVLALEARKLIRRRVSETHARVMRIRLTAQGKTLVETCDRATLPIEERLLASLSKTDAVALRRVLKACVDSLTEREPSHLEAGKENRHDGSRGQARAHLHRE